MKKPTNVPVPKTARTEQNKLMRMARHAKRYPHTHKLDAPKRRQLGRIWKAERDRRAGINQYVPATKDTTSSQVQS